MRIGKNNIPLQRINGDCSHSIGSVEQISDLVKSGITILMGTYTVREVIWALEQNGWERVRWRGDHRQYRCKGNRYVITVAGHLKDDIPIGTLRNIERLSGLCFAEIFG